MTAARARSPAQRLASASDGRAGRRGPAGIDGTRQTSATVAPAHGPSSRRGWSRGGRGHEQHGQADGEGEHTRPAHRGPQPDQQPGGGEGQSEAAGRVDPARQHHQGNRRQHRGGPVG